MIGLKIVRLLNDKTMKEVGSYIGVSQQAICNYEKGRRKISNSKIEQLAEHFNVSVEVLKKEIDVDVKKILDFLLEESI